MTNRIWSQTFLRVRSHALKDINMKEKESWLNGAKKICKKNKWDSVKTGEYMKIKHLLDLYRKYSKDDRPVSNEDRKHYNGND